MHFRKQKIILFFVAIQWLDMYISENELALRRRT